MSGNTAKPPSAPAESETTGIPVVDLVFDDRQQTLVLRGTAMLLDRSETCDVVVDNDGLSREHAKFTVARDGLVQLLDLESTNGSFVNGERITA